MSRLGGKAMSENTDADELATGVVETIVAGTNVSVNSADPVNPVVSATDTGEANTASNVGTGTGDVLKQKVGVDLELKTIKAGTNITIINNTSDIEIAASGGSSTFHGVLVEDSDTVARTGASFTATYDTEVYDTDSFADLGTDNNRVTVPANVTKVQVAAHLDCTGITAGSNNFISISHFNSADTFQRAYGASQQNGDTSIFDIIITPVITVASGDYFTLVAQSSDTSWSQTYVSLSLEYKDGTL